LWVRGCYSQQMLQSCFTYSNTTIFFWVSGCYSQQMLQSCFTYSNTTIFFWVSGWLNDYSCPWQQDECNDLLLSAKKDHFKRPTVVSSPRVKFSFLNCNAWPGDILGDTWYCFVGYHYFLTYISSAHLRLLLFNLENFVCFTHWSCMCKIGLYVYLYVSNLIIYFYLWHWETYFVPPLHYSIFIWLNINIVMFSY
jgi:hypothetical protein